MEDVLPSRGIENATPEIPLGSDPLEFVCQDSQAGFGN